MKLEIVRPPKWAFKNVYIMYWCERPIGRERKILEILQYIIPKIALKMRSFGWKLKLSPPLKHCFRGEVPRVKVKMGGDSPPEKNSPPLRGGGYKTLQIFLL